MGVILTAHKPTPAEVQLHRAKLSMMGITSGIEPMPSNEYYKRRKKMEKETFPIYIYGDSMLREKCVKASKEYDIKRLVQKMRNTLKTTSRGVGLAAPQVGIPVRVFLGPDDIAFINFEILELKGSRPRAQESCLSMPGISGFVRRHQKVKIKWFDENWVEHTKTFKNFDAVLIQHEADHCDGILYIDRMEDKKERAALEIKLLDFEDNVIPDSVEYETNID